MTIINFMSNLAMPLVILMIALYGIIEKNTVFDDFIEGAKEGLEIVFSILPTLVGLFVAIGALRHSGILDMMIRLIMPFLNMVHSMSIHA